MIWWCGVFGERWNILRSILFSDGDSDLLISPCLPFTLRRLTCCSFDIQTEKPEVFLMFMFIFLFTCSRNMQWIKLSKSVYSSISLLFLSYCLVKWSMFFSFIYINKTVSIYHVYQMLSNIMSNCKNRKVESFCQQMKVLFCFCYDPSGHTSLFLCLFSYFPK